MKIPFRSEPPVANQELVPAALTENRIAPRAFQNAEDVLLSLEHLYSSRKSLDEQRMSTGLDQAEELIENYTSPDEKEDPEINWQRQFLTVFAAFYELGVSRAKGEGDSSNGSDQPKFVARCVQTHLIETNKPQEVKVAGASTPFEIQHLALIATAKFALATGYDNVNSEKYDPSKPLLDVVERVSLGAGNIKQRVTEDANNPEDKQLFSTRNI